MNRDYFQDALQTFNNTNVNYTAAQFKRLGDT